MPRHLSEAVEIQLRYFKGKVCAIQLYMEPVIYTHPPPLPRPLPDSAVLHLESRLALLLPRRAVPADERLQLRPLPQLAHVPDEQKELALLHQRQPVWVLICSEHGWKAGGFSFIFYFIFFIFFFFFPFSFCRRLSFCCILLLLYFARFSISFFSAGGLFFCGGFFVLFVFVRARHHSPGQQAWQSSCPLPGHHCSPPAVPPWQQPAMLPTRQHEAMKKVVHGCAVQRALGGLQGVQQGAKDEEGSSCTHASGCLHRISLHRISLHRSSQPLRFCVRPAVMLHALPNAAHPPAAAASCL